jgi:hypothetical protein
VSDAWLATTGTQSWARNRFLAGSAPVRVPRLAVILMRRPATWTKPPTSPFAIAARDLQVGFTGTEYSVIHYTVYQKSSKINIVLFTISHLNSVTCELFFFEVFGWTTIAMQKSEFNNFREKYATTVYSDISFIIWPAYRCRETARQSFSVKKKTVMVCLFFSVRKILVWKQFISYLFIIYSNFNQKSFALWS